jgi:hypothetical protein
VLVARDHDQSVGSVARQPIRTVAREPGSQPERGGLAVLVLVDA